MREGEIIDYRVWREDRRRLLSRQLELLTGRAQDRSDPHRPQIHRPRSEDHWSAVADGVRAEFERREASGRWAWLERRRLVIRSR